MKKYTDEDFMWDILSTPANIDWDEFRYKHSNIWLTIERKILRIKDMNSDHINSCVALLVRKGQQDSAAFYGLTMELARRETLNALKKIERSKGKR